MKILSKPTTAVAVGLASVLALGACSSSTDQAQPNREAEAAQASPTVPVGLPASLGDNFKDVVVTHSAPSRCKTSASANKKQLVVDCDGVGANVFGDQIFVGMPNGKYEVQVENISTNVHTSLQTTRRDWAYRERGKNTWDDFTWTTPYETKGTKSTYRWGVGIDAVDGAGLAHVVATVRYLG